MSRVDLDALLNSAAVHCEVPHGTLVLVYEDDLRALVQEARLARKCIEAAEDSAHHHYDECASNRSEIIDHLGTRARCACNCGTRELVQALDAYAEGVGSPVGGRKHAEGGK